MGKLEMILEGGIKKIKHDVSLDVRNVGKKELRKNGFWFLIQATVC